MSVVILRGYVTAETVADPMFGGLSAFRGARRRMVRELPTEEVPMRLRPVLIGSHGRRRSDGQLGLGIDEAMLPTMRWPIRGVWRIRHDRQSQVFVLTVYAAATDERELAVREAASARATRRVSRMIVAWD